MNDCAAGASELDWAWAAGIFEGEGCIVIRKRLRTVCLCLKMADLDIVERFQAIAGCGRLRIERAKSFRHRDCHIWSICTRRDVLRILAILRPHMGSRRGARIDEAILHYSRPRDGGWVCDGQYQSSRGYQLGCRCGRCCELKQAEDRIYNRTKRKKWRAQKSPDNQPQLEGLVIGASSA